MEMLEFRGISKTFSSTSVKSSAGKDTTNYAVQNLSLTIHEGEFFSLLGPSGCGKTTLLRMIAGLEFPSEGEIFLHEKRIDQVPAQERPFNMVFQKYALFPHLSVFENVAFGLKIKKIPATEVKERVESALQLVNMASFGDRKPETLSGGQSQRVAIARALVNRPQILLLDEPLSALDQKLREHMQNELKELQQKLGLTFIYVTHDQEEALALSDRIGVMNHGRLEQVSAPRDLYHQPGTLFTAQFVGPSTSFKNGSHSVLVRPEKVRVARNEFPGSHLQQFCGTLMQKTFKGAHTEVTVQIVLPQGEKALVKALVLDHEIEPQFQVGFSVWVSFDPKDSFHFSGKSE